MSAGPAESESDFEINLAPIIDCFTVLITYLLVSASFLSLNILDVQVATSTDTPPPPEMKLDPQDSLSIELMPNNVMWLVISGKNNIRMEIAPGKDTAGKENWDLERLKSEVERLKKRWPELGEVSVKSEPTVEYKKVFRVIETLKRQVPKVFLGE